MIFTRDTIAFWVCLGNEVISRNTPSTRNRTRNPFSCGSIWMSLAPVFTA